MHRIPCLSLFCGLAAMAAAGADTIVVNGVVYDGVYIREGRECYYVQLPEVGGTLSFAKSGVRPEDVRICADENAREALLETWREKRRAIAEHARPSLDEPPARLHVKDPLSDLQRIRQYEEERGIREKYASLESGGTPKLVLRGSDRKDPIREQYIAERVQEQREREAAARDQRRREEQQFLLEQRRIDAELALRTQQHAAREAVWPVPFLWWPRPSVYVYNEPWWIIGRSMGGKTTPAHRSQTGDLGIRRDDNVLHHGGDYTDGRSHGGDYLNDTRLLT